MSERVCEAGERAVAREGGHELGRFPRGGAFLRARRREEPTSNATSPFTDTLLERPIFSLSPSPFLSLFRIARSWPFLVGFAVTGAIFTSIALSVTDEDIKKSSKCLS